MWSQAQVAFSNHNWQSSEKLSFHKPKLNSDPEGCGLPSAGRGSAVTSAVLSRSSAPQRSEGALQQTVAAAPGRTLVLPAEPVHHVTGVSSVSTAQAEVGRAPNGHVADGTLEGQVFAHGTLGPPGLAAAVAAVHAELWGQDRPSALALSHRGQRPSALAPSHRRSRDRCGPTDPPVRFRSAGGELEHVGPLVPQAPAVQDLPVTLLKVVKLQHVGGIQQPAAGSDITRGVLTSPRLSPLTSCSCRAAPAPSPGDLWERGCRGDSRQGRTLPRGCRVQSLVL